MRILGLVEEDVRNDHPAALETEVIFNYFSFYGFNSSKIKVAVF